MSDDDRTIAIIGCGTIGLALAAAFASRGLDVQGVDTDADRVAQLRRGEVPFVEPGLAEAVVVAAAEGRLSFASAFARPPGSSCAFIVAVPTPVDDAKMLDRSFLDAAEAAIKDCAQDGDLLIMRSTVPIGTTRGLAQAIRQRGVALLAACCPDRSVAGQSFLDQFAFPNVVGGLDPASSEAAAALFSRLGAVRCLEAPEAAEALKLFSNVQRDIGFAVANQFALVCDRLGLDFHAIRDAARDRYPRFSVARPGPVGGPCLSKDSDQLALSVAEDTSLVSLPLAARDVNRSLAGHVLTIVLDHIARAKTQDGVIAVLGLAFKGLPATRDCRNSFGTELVAQLRAGLPRSTIKGWDPVAPELRREVPFAGVIEGADVLVLANDHPLVQQLDAARAAAAMRHGGLIYNVCGPTPKGAGGLPNGVRFLSLGGGRGPWQPQAAATTSAALGAG